MTRALNRALWLTCVAFATCVQAVAADQDADSPKAIEVAPGEGYVLVVPGAMTTRELQWFASVLVLSEEQNSVLVGIVRDYYKQWKVIDQDRGPGLLERSRKAEFTARSARAYDQESVAAFRELADFERATVRLQDRLDESVFERLGEILTDEQQAQLTKVKASRKVQSCRARSRTLEMPSARIDLAAILFEFDVASGASPELMSIVVDYHAALAPLVSELREMYWEHLAKFASLVHDVVYDESDLPRDVTLPSHTDLEARFRRETQRMMTPSGRLQRRVVEVNRKYFAEIQRLLPASTSAWFTEQYVRSAYPRVYPDVLNCVTFHEDVRKLAGLDQAHGDAILAVFEHCERENSRVSTAMETLSDDWDEHFATTRNTSGIDEFRARMRELRDARWRRTMEFVDQVESLAPHDLTEQIKPLIAEIRERAARLQRVAATDNYPF